MVWIIEGVVLYFLPILTFHEKEKALPVEGIQNFRILKQIDGLLVKVDPDVGLG